MHCAPRKSTLLTHSCPRGAEQCNTICTKDMNMIHCTKCTCLLDCLYRVALTDVHSPELVLSAVTSPHGCILLCSGEDQDGIKPKIKLLYKNGIGGILDYAAEDDMNADDGPAAKGEPGEKVVARVFDYGSEDVCDGHMRVFMKSIEAAAEAPGRGFAAIKVRHIAHAHHEPSCCKQLVACQLPASSGNYLQLT